MVHIPSARRVVGALALAAAWLPAAGCATLPRSGPLAVEIDRRSTEDEPEGLVVQLTPDMAALVNREPARRFPQAFLTAAEIQPYALGVGDALDVLTWEPGGATLFGAGGADDGAATGVGALPSVRVGPDGSIFIPYLGSTRAAGLTAETLRERLRDGLAAFASGLEVDVRLREARSRMVTIQGSVAKPGVYMIEPGFTRLVPILALAGGAPLPPEQVEVSVRRGGVAGAEMLEDIYADPALNIALRPDDIVVLNPIRERFVALGASSAQAEITFPTRRLTLLSALGAAAGLRDFEADPQGVFVLRLEDAALADSLLPGPPPVAVAGDLRRPVAYRLDLTKPEGLFAAKTFLVRDGDAIFVANAPLTEVRKVLQLFTSALVPVQQTTAISP